MLASTSVIQYFIQPSVNKHIKTRLMFKTSIVNLQKI